METRAKKRARLEKAQTPKEEQEPKLKCHEMRLIFQRLPTSELIRFISRQPKPPLGKFWSQELKFVVEMRLPFSVKATASSRGGGTPSDHVIYDCNGSRIAKIKRPKQFRLSPVCELIESAEVPAIACSVSSLPPRFVYPTPDILAALTSLDSLTVSVYLMVSPDMRGPVDLPAALNTEVASRIHSLTIVSQYHGECLQEPILDIITRATGLKKLSLPYVSLSSRALLAALPVRSSLESLSVHNLYVRSVAEPLLGTLRTRFNGLRELLLPVRAPIRQYLAAFRALPSLTTLGLVVSQIHAYRVDENETELSVDENDSPVGSVTELYIAWISAGKEPLALLTMLSKFPSVRTFGVDFHAHDRTNRHGHFLLQFASAVCVNEVFAQLQTLKLFRNASLTRDALLQFIRTNIDHLPSFVDLSQVKTDWPTNVNRDFLVDLYLALQGGRVTSLALKDVVHREAVPRLREHLAFTKQDKPTPQANVGKILTWIDEGSIDERRIRSQAAGWPQAVSEFTDFRIEAHKTSGPLKGSLFTVRISDWTEERERFFDE